MADHPIREHLSLQIAHHLMNFNHHTIGFLLFEAERFDLRIDQPSLPGPVRAHRLRPVHRAAFQPVGPFDLRMQQRQGRLEVATVESRVGSL